MALELGSLVVKIQADVADLKKGMSDATNAVNGLGATTVAKGNLISDAFLEMGKQAVNFVTGSIKAFGQHEQIMVRLGAMVGGPVASAYEKWASELQKTTTYNDEAILSLQTQLANYGVLPGSIERVTKAVMDYASATGKDLPEAGTVMGQAMNGMSRELNKFGLALYQGSTRTENLERTTGFLEQRFQGMSQTIAGTVLGKIDNLHNRFEDLKELIGREALPVFNAWASVLGVVINKIEQMTGASENNNSVNDIAIKKLEEERKQLTEFGKLYGGLDQAQAARVIMLTRMINELKKHTEAQHQDTKATHEATGAVEKLTDAGEEQISMLHKQLRETQQVYTQIDKITELTAQKQIADAMNSFNVQASYSQALAVRIAQDTQSWGMVFASTTMGMVDTFSRGIGQMIGTGGNFKDAMKNIGLQMLQDFVGNLVKQMLISFLTAVGLMKTAYGSLLSTMGAPGAGAAAGASGSAMLGLAGGLAGFGAGSMMGGHMYGEDSSQSGANIGAGIGAIGGTLMFGPLGGLLGGALGGIVGGGIKKLFSGGTISEPTLMIGTQSGDVGLAAESGPEALMSFREMGLTPEEGRRRLVGNPGHDKSSSGGGSVQLHFNISGQFLEANPAKWQRVLRSVVIPEVRRYSMVNPSGPFNRKRGQL